MIIMQICISVRNYLVPLIKPNRRQYHTVSRCQDTPNVINGVKADHKSMFVTRDDRQDNESYACYLFTKL